MAIEVGNTIPDGELKSPTATGLESVQLSSFCAGRKVVLFGVPGAFTPTCQDTHLPGFQVREDALREKGVAAIGCVATNDAFVLGAWAQARNVGDSVMMLADGNGEWIERAGLALDLAHFGMGTRSKRFAAIVDNGVVTYLGVEPGGDVGVSGADAVLEALDG